MNALLLIVLCLGVIGAILFYAFEGFNADFSNDTVNLDNWISDYPYLFFVLVVIGGGIYLVDFIKDRKEKNFLGMVNGLIGISLVIFFLYLCYAYFQAQ